MKIPMQLHLPICFLTKLSQNLTKKQLTFKNLLL